MNECSILKRGLPIIYEYSLVDNNNVSNDNNNIIIQNVNNNNNNEKTFNDELFKYLNELFKTKIISKISLLQLKIISEFSFQISYDLEYKNWLLTSNDKNKCFIFNNLIDLNDFKKDKKISKNEYNIIKIWLNFLEKNFENVNENNLLNEFLQFCNNNTLLGFYVGDKNSLFSKDFYNEKKLIFFNIISNHEKFSNFSFSFNKTENIFNKFKLDFINFKTIKENINNIQSFKKEINILYNNISEDFYENQKCGSLFVIQSDKRIVSSFKIMNNETKVINDLKINFNENEEEFYKKFKKLKLPRALSYYLDMGKDFKKNKTNEYDIFSNNMDKVDTVKYEKNIIENNHFNNEKINNNDKNKNYENDNNNNNKLILLDETNEINDNNNNNIISSIIYKENDYDKNFDIKNNNENYNNIKTIKNIDNKNSNNFNSKEISLGSQFNSETDDFSIKRSRTISKKFKFNNNKFINKKIFSNSYYQYNLFKKNNSIIQKKNKRVKFNDVEFNKPLVDVVIIKSYKKYNASNNYNGNDLNEKDDNKNMCCIIL